MFYQTQTYNPSTFFTEPCAGQPESGKKIVQTFTSVDPLADKYSGISPYVYCANNPMIYVDPDGKKIVIAGSAEFRKATFNDMQKLSSNNLIMLKNGTVVEASSYNGAKSNIAITGKATGGKKDFGTNLIKGLSSNQKHTVTIKQGSDEDNSFFPTNGNFSNAQNPKIGSGGKIDYDPESTGYNIVNEDGTTRIDAYIQLGHELIHADKAMKGKMLNVNDKVKVDPDGLPAVHRKISSEEVDTRKSENIIRKENNEKLREKP